MARRTDWSRSLSTDATLEKLVADGLMPPREIGGWRPAFVEQTPQPYDDEMVVFEEYYRHGFGNPCHPFLRDLIECHPPSQLYSCYLRLHHPL